MKITKIAAVVSFVCSITTYSQNIHVYKRSEKIIIDGDLSDWKKPFLGPFVVHNSGKKATQNTMVSLSWNDENLYIAYRSTDSKIVGTNQKKDSQIFNTDDLVEIFIDPDGDGQNYIEIGVNAFSSNYDMLLKCISPVCGGWNTSMAFNITGMETQSKITREGFTTEIKIPFSSLKTIPNGNFNKPKIGTKWRGNTFRIDYGNTTEYLTLQPYKSGKFGFHQPQEFAVFEFVE
ncbi:carbohydrate binding protein with CBM9 domain [Flavobacterium sp. 90]|uniref:carbohydrate-binding family 9-like protein n=1 Tax=unclassified Flavobacterium TaxID=196869 RepID=UPI000EAD69D8|nr:MULTISPECIES: carbohydrate-binding family 9-like protein [unclassified Flavobacterium]RKR05425.1 carbohydrate binding protein with CBM9 domain [Flavobacterium sp. 81]TCK56740.1 carbohydrate binding protein with CBM9 domain [Flavobacterium sp. 90]